MNNSCEKFQLEVQLRPTERALTELEKALNNAFIYTSIRSLMVRPEDKDSVEKELKEKIETIDI